MRRKEVFKSSELAHVWANQSAPQGRCPSSMSFNGPAFYSYATVIARIIKHKGKTAYVVDGESFSHSTSKHQGAVRHAIRDSAKVFTVYEGSYGQRLDFTPAQLRDHYLNLFRDTDTAGAKSRYEFKRAEATVKRFHNLDLAINVCQYFKLGRNRLDGVSLRNQGEYNAALEIVAARDLKRNRARYERERIALDKREKDYAEALPLWLAGQNVRLPYEPNKPVMLRVVNSDPDHFVMETTMGARVPLADAERTFRFVMIQRARGWRSNGEKHAVGMYHLDAVNERGVVAGCHRVAWQEIERFAKLQGWL